MFLRPRIMMFLLFLLRSGSWTRAIRVAGPREGQGAVFAERLLKGLVPRATPAPAGRRREPSVRPAAGQETQRLLPSLPPPRPDPRHASPLHPLFSITKPTDPGHEGLQPCQEASLPLYLAAFHSSPCSGDDPLYPYLLPPSPHPP